MIADLKRKHMRLKRRTNHGRGKEKTADLCWIEDSGG